MKTSSAQPAIRFLVGSMVLGIALCLPIDANAADQPKLKLACPAGVKPVTYNCAQRCVADPTVTLEGAKNCLLLCRGRSGHLCTVTQE